jgi:hypothetical protein
MLQFVSAEIESAASIRDARSIWAAEGATVTSVNALLKIFKRLSATVSRGSRISKRRDVNKVGTVLFCVRIVARRCEAAVGGAGAPEISTETRERAAAPAGRGGGGVEILGIRIGS